MSIEERISLVEERVAEMLMKHDKLIQLHELLLKQHTELRDQHHQLRAETGRQRVDMETKVSLLSTMIGISADQLTGNLNLLSFPDLLRKRLANQQN